MNKKIEKNINKITQGCYCPTKTDIVRIYNSISHDNPQNEISGILSEIFDWLSQVPQSIPYKKGVLYIRPELDPVDVFVYHVIFIDEVKKRYIDEKISDSDGLLFEYDIKTYLPNIKESIFNIIEDSSMILQ